MGKTLTMVTKESERRTDTRLELSLPITLFVDPKIELLSKNISTGGVSFYINADKLELFPLGKIVNLEIAAKIFIPRLPERAVTLAGDGLVIRVNSQEEHAHSRNKKWCIALKYTETLKVKL
ncbi:MAG: PilZ domain-containing protein [Planctomycetes bacterium]|nr:PilZ domain-containing protein [Planctomycetota bacterium]